MPRYTLTIDVPPRYQEDFEKAAKLLVDEGPVLQLRSPGANLDMVQSELVKIARHAQKEEVWKADAE